MKVSKYIVIIVCVIFVFSTCILIKEVQKQLSLSDNFNNERDNSFSNCELKTYNVNIFISDDNAEELIENYIKTNLNSDFNKNDYTISMENSYIKYTYTPNQIKTSNSYTAIIENNRIVDINECIVEDFDSLQFLKNESLLSEAKQNQIQSDLLDSFENDNIIITIIDSGHIYKNGKVQYYIIYKQESSKQLPSSDIKYYDIEEEKD